MEIWLISVCDPVPTDGASVRPHRTGILADLLVERGHHVLWWASTFNHQKKDRRFGRDTFLEVRPGFRLALLHSFAYRRNVSLSRLMNYQGIARKFARYLRAERPPDVILCCWPTIELGVEAVRYGRRMGVPVILDVRDLWPDTFPGLLPRALRPLGRLAARPMMRQACCAMQGADAIVAISEGTLQWALGYAGRQAGPDDAVFPLGYPEPKVKPEALDAAGAALRRRGVDPSRLICWFVGSFGKMYDLETVLRAARTCASRGNSHVQFVLSGEGEEGSRWRELARGLENVVFTGWIDVPEIAAMMRIADIGLAAVRPVPHALPNKIFEYMAGGLPVLSSLPGDTAALLAHHACGLTYAPGDVESFLAALELLVNDEDLRRGMAANARRAFREQYAAGVVYSRLADYLEETVRSRSGHSFPAART